MQVVTPEGSLLNASVTILDGADEDREEGWRDYVSAVASAAGVA